MLFKTQKTETEANRREYFEANFSKWSKWKRYAKTTKQENIKWIWSRFASIHFIANKFLKRTRRTLGQMGHWQAFATLDCRDSLQIFKSINYLTKGTKKHTNYVWIMFHRKKCSFCYYRSIRIFSLRWQGRNSSKILFGT
jgi:hypothetical protein